MPIVDLRAVDPVAYQQDHNDCWVLVQRHADPNVGVMAGPKAAATSAAGAAVVGVATGASSSVMSADIVTGAIGGMIAGPMVDSYLQDIGKQFWVGRCLENRGYEIINADDVRLTPYKFCMMNCPISSGIGCGNWAETNWFSVKRYAMSASSANGRNGGPKSRSTPSLLAC
ncbi:MAG: hypothetical protein HY055_01445 [Magnetospirillum sp.]|nr:hypothetical protein [Magnetospirillum sp.]